MRLEGAVIRKRSFREAEVKWKESVRNWIWRYYGDRAQAWFWDMT